MGGFFMAGDEVAGEVVLYSCADVGLWLKEDSTPAQSPWSYGLGIGLRIRCRAKIVNRVVCSFDS